MKITNQVEIFSYQKMQHILLHPVYYFSEYCEDEVHVYLLWHDSPWWHCSHTLHAAYATHKVAKSHEETPIWSEIKVHRYSLSTGCL